MFLRNIVVSSVAVQHKNIFLLRIHFSAFDARAHMNASTEQHQSSPLLSWQQLLPWQQDNQYILSQYRPASSSYSLSLKSITRIHNQSINIHTHLLGSLFFIACAYHFHNVLLPQYPSASDADIFVFDAFFLGAITCLSISATFHALANHSARVCRSWLLYDMMGISCLTTGSFFPGVFYGFYCEPDVIRTYWSMVRASLHYDTRICRMDSWPN